MVDTSQLIKDEHDIFSSRRVACILENDQLHNMIISSPTKNILSRIFQEKTRLGPDMTKERELFEGENCLISRDYKMTQLFSSEIFLVGERHTADLLMSTFEGFEGIFNKLWISETIYEYNLVAYYNGDKPEIGRG